MPGGADSGGVEIEIVYARPQEPRRYRLVVAQGTTAIEAVRLSGVLADFPEIDVQRDGLAVFGRRIPLEHALAPGDRIEVLRPLRVDPQTARRLRVRRERK